jgi:hypothetical protein
LRSLSTSFVAEGIIAPAADGVVLLSVVVVPVPVEVVVPVPIEVVVPDVVEVPDVVGVTAGVEASGVLDGSLGARAATGEPDPEEDSAMLPPPHADNKDAEQSNARIEVHRVSRTAVFINPFPICVCFEIADEHAVIP